ncbi:DUF58 domain-containing protein [Ectothiorhodospiraceae bacterium WFHF3C12]|nr:DUF58 domain-containing protein [Ectothiorhodospiraceae bacterium WFHF3C12]
MTAVYGRLQTLLEGWMRRRSRESTPPIRLRYRRVYILPTRNGWLFVVLLTAMWLGAVNYSNSMIFILVFLLVGVSVVSILHTFANLVNVSVTMGRVEPVFAGDPLFFPVRLHNPSSKARIAVGLRMAREPQGFTDLPPNGDGIVHVERPTQRRGPVRLTRFDVFTTFPLGLFVAWSPVWIAAEGLAFPRPETGSVPPPSGGAGAGTGDLRTEGSEDFAGLRRYRPGDPVRHIAWKSGHARELQTKRFAAEGASRLWMDYERTAVNGVEARLSRLCRWILDAESEGQSFGLRLPGLEIPPDHGPRHSRRCLEALARFGS